MNVTGGSAYSASGTATAENNSVTISGGTAQGNVYGGYAESASDLPTAKNNSVTVNSGGTVRGNVYGGYAYRDSGGRAMATGNNVIISGGTVQGNVYGGFAGSLSGTATGNSVTISGSPILTGNLYGGYVSGGSSFGDVFTDNTLNLKSSGLTVGGLENFEHLNFYLPTSFAAGQTMLTVTGTADLTDGGSRSSTVNVGIDGASSPLQAGEQVVLIDASAGALVVNSGLNTTANGQGMQGVTLQYEFDLLAANNLLTATVTSTGLNEQTKALSEGFLAGMGLVNQGADAIAGQGMEFAVRSARAGLSGGYGLAGFGTLSGGWSRLNTGSHVDMSSLSLMTGLSARNSNPVI
jgi:hypothetical protein